MSMIACCLYRPRVRIDLLELHLMRGHWSTCAIEDEESGARCSLIDRTNEPISGLRPFFGNTLRVLALP